MKKLSFLALAAVGLLFGACSENDVINESKNSLDGEGQGYFKVGIHLPTAPVVSTRATTWTESDNLDDGLGYEYQIKNNDILLLLFDGADERQATLTQVIPLTNTQAAHTDNPNQITTKGTYVAKLDNAPKKNLFALAVVNGSINTGIVTQGSAANSIKINNGTEQTGITLQDLLTAVSASTSVDANAFVEGTGNDTYIFMTNAVLSKSAGGTTNPTASPELQILAPVDATKLYKTKEAADDESAAAAVDIYVERGVAKVTIKQGADYLKTTVTSGETTTNHITTSNGSALTASNVTLAGWCLDNTNKKSYVVRQVPGYLDAATPVNAWNLVSKQFASSGGGDKYRFVGGNAVEDGKTLYRTYWAYDPNYNSDATDADFASATASNLTSGVGDNNPKYCFENTFTVARQSFKNTTRAILAVRLNGTGSNTTFYTMGADRNTLYTEDDVKNTIATNLMNQPNFKNWFKKVGAANVTLSGSDLDITWTAGVEAGDIDVVSIVVPASKLNTTYYTSNVTLTSSTGTLDDYDLSNVISTINTQLVSVEKFKDGIAYYQIRIKHFGDDLTPWNSSEYKSTFQPKESTISDIYPDADDNRQNDNYLGRYGMVRNNWYELEIGAILKIGSSTIPSLSTDHPDDELEDLYIKARINILSWAKRPQSTDLK